MKKVHNETPDTASPLSTEQYKKMLVISLIKMSIPLVLCTVVFCLASVAWFAKNTSVKGSGMTIVAADPKYVISVLDSGNNGKYYDKYHILVRDPSAIVWQMTADNNMDNDEDSSTNGIHPGSYGVISFFVTPKVESVNLKFTFEIVGYVSGETGEEGSKEITMTSLEQSDVPAKYLNGHLLLFGGRTTNTLEDGSSVITYSDPILSNKDMMRVIDSKTFSGVNTPTRVDIYWVWPRTLSTLVDARGCQNVKVTVAPFTEGDAYGNIVENILSNPGFFLKETSITEPSAGSGEGENTESGPSQGASLTEEIIASEYQRYGDYYDQADNDIGMGVDFILLKLSVEEADSSGG